MDNVIRPKVVTRLELLLFKPAFPLIQCSLSMPVAILAGGYCTHRFAERVKERVKKASFVTCWVVRQGAA